MRLILAVSADGYFASGPEDDMSWTTPSDKAVFRLLTGSGGACGAGSRTFDQLPELPGRTVFRLTRSPDAPGAPPDHSATLEWFAHRHPDGWLLGGPEIAQVAVEQNLVESAYLCRSPVPLGGGIRDRLTPWLMTRGEWSNMGTPWRRAQRIPVGDIVVDVWRNLCPTAVVSPPSGDGSKTTSRSSRPRA
jgi:dihydrofolate reductase